MVMKIWMSWILISVVIYIAVCLTYMIISQSTMTWIHTKKQALYWFRKLLVRPVRKLWGMLWTR